jgi:hypothetical protein
VENKTEAFFEEEKAYSEIESATESYLCCKESFIPEKLSHKLLDS